MGEALRFYIVKKNLRPKRLHQAYIVCCTIRRGSGKVYHIELRTDAERSTNTCDTAGSYNFEVI